MIRRSLFLAAALFLAASPSAYAATADDIQLWVDADLTVYLHNVTAADISFDGYQIASEFNDLDVAGWDSISDRIPGRINDLIADLGAGALGFGELSPTTAQIAEGNLTGVGVLKAGAKFSLGKPFRSFDYCSNSVAFYFKIGGIPTQFEGHSLICPEPSTWLLATLAGLGLVAMRLKKLRSGVRRSK